jgi:hypothetical protein
MRKIFELAGKIAVEGLTALEKGMKDADKNLAKFDKSITKFGRQCTKIGTTLSKNLTAPIAAAGAAVSFLTLKTGQYADKLLDLEQITGLNSDSLQEYEHVARVAGVSFEGLVDTITKFTNSLPEIRKGTGPAAEAVEKFGLNIFDSNGNIKDMNILFPQLLDKLRTVQNVTERNAISQDIFGRSLKDLAPVLGMTSQQMRDAMQEAHNLGLVIDREGLESANNFRIEVEKLKGEFEVLVRKVSIDLIPVFRDTLFPLIKSKIIPAIQEAAGKVVSMIDWFKGLSSETKENIFKFTAFIAIIGPVILAVGKLIAVSKGLIITIGLVRTAFVGLSVAMGTNPFGLALVGVSLLVTGLIALKNAYDDVKKRRDQEKNAVVDETAELKKLRTEWQEELIWLEKQKNPSVDMVNRMADLRDGIAQVSESLGELKKESEEVPPFVPPKDIEAIAKMNEEWSKKLAQITENRLEANERERKAAVAAAQKIGAETTNIEQFYTLQRENIIAEEARARQDKYKKEEEAAKNAARTITEIESQWHLKRMEQTGDRIGVLRAEMDEAIALATEKGAQTADIEAYYQAEIRKEQDKTRENERSGIIETIGLWTDKLGNLGASFAQIFDQMAANRMASTDKWYSREKSAIEKSTANEREKRIKFDALDKQYNEKKAALQREAAKKSKALSIFEAIIGTASAVIGALGAKPWTVANFIMAGIVGTIGAIKTALIARQPLPLAEGALVKSRPGRGIIAQIAEGGQDEAVFPVKTGVALIVDGIIDRIGDLFSPIFNAGAGGGAGLAGAGGLAPIHIHFEHFYGDDRSYKELERRLYQFRVAEAQRKGRENEY